MDTKTMTFPERAKRMAALANDLTAMSNLALKFADEVADEALRMQAAAARFEKRQAERPTRKAA